MVIEADPQVTQVRKYCDITGLVAPYTDPVSQLRYYNSQVFKYVRSLSDAEVRERLSLRGGGSTDS